jgi:hypothetical protein
MCGSEGSERVSVSRTRSCAMCVFADFIFELVRELLLDQRQLTV